MGTTDRVQRAAGRLSAAQRWGGDVRARQADLREAQLEKTILAALPSLSDEARERLARLLHDGDLI